MSILSSQPVIYKNFITSDKEWEKANKTLEETNVKWSKLDSTVTKQVRERDHKISTDSFLKERLKDYKAIKENYETFETLEKNLQRGTISKSEQNNVLSRVKDILKSKQELANKGLQFANFLQRQLSKA